MSSGGDKVVTVRLKFVTDDEAARRGLKMLASDADHAAAAQAKLNAQRRAARSPGAGADHRSAVADMYGLRDDGGGPLRGPDPVKARLRGESRSERRAGELAVKRAEESKFERYMAGRGLTRDGDRLPVERGLVGRGLEALGGRLGLPAGAGAGLGTASLLAAPLVAGKTALDQYVQARQIDATPFLTPGDARERKLRGLPFGAGRAYGYFEDARAAVSGDLDARRASAEKLAIDQFRQPRERDVLLRQDEYRASARSAQNEATAMKGLRLDRIDPGLDRSTVRGQQEYDLQRKLLPAKQAITVATQRQAAAEEDVADATREQVQRQKELADARRRYDEAERQRRKAGGRPTDVDDHRLAPWNWSKRQFGYGTEPGGGGYDRTQFDARDTDANDAAGELATAKERAKAADKRKVEADNRLNERKGETNAARVARTRAELGDAEDRVGRAEAGARTLGGLGRAGRQEAKVALEMVQRLGVDNVDPETVSLAESVAPEVVGKLKEQAGEAAKGEFRRLAPDEKQLADLGQARKREEGLREKATGEEETGIRDKAQGIADALKGLAATYEKELDFIKVEVEGLKRDAERRAGNIDR